MREGYGFLVGGPPEQIRMVEELMEGNDGYMGMEIVGEGLYLLTFSDRESAITAQWILEMNKATATGGAGKHESAGTEPGE